ncbi:AraC family transcriptional regulator [Halalkalibacter akibai]|nr:AraC family transcriptional regulator [Halalkalibacter akibai]
MKTISLFDEELLNIDYHPSVVFYYFKQWDVYTMEFHAHPAVEIMFVISGECLVDLESQAVSIKKGQFILIDANVKHRLIVSEGNPCRMLNIEFLFKEKKSNFPSIRELANENKSLRMFLNVNKPFIILEDPNEVYQTLKGLILEIDEKNEDNHIMISLLISQLLIRIANLVNSMESKKISRNKNPYIKRTIDFIHHNYDREIKVQNIADAVHLHPSYLHRLFKTYMNKSILEYLTTHRMEKAKELLLKTDIPVSDISDYIGINSRQYFSTVFKKYMKMSPSEFRNCVQKNIGG